MPSPLLPLPEPIRLVYTVWRFRDLRGAETTSVRVSEPDDLLYQHEYQRVLWRGFAFTRAEALANAR